MNRIQLRHVYTPPNSSFFQGSTQIHWPVPLLTDLTYLSISVRSRPSWKHLPHWLLRYTLSEFFSEKTVQTPSWFFPVSLTTRCNARDWISGLALSIFTLSCQVTSSGFIALTIIHILTARIDFSSPSVFPELQICLSKYSPHFSTWMSNRHPNLSPDCRNCLTDFSAFLLAPSYHLPSLCSTQEPKWSC